MSDKGVPTIYLLRELYHVRVALNDETLKILDELEVLTVAHLSKREYRAFWLRFGKHGEKQLTYQEVGKQLGEKPLSRERGRQIVMRAMWKLNHPKVKRKLADMIEKARDEHKTI